MDRFLSRLLNASKWGATLVILTGAASSVGCTENGGGSGGNGGNEGTPTEIVDPNGDPLGPLPELACEGPIYMDDFGYHGQCCYEVHCAAAVNSACATPQDAALSNLPPGSGECECGTRSGPFANNDAMASDNCCYLVGSIGCDGRPFMIHGAPRLAPLRQKRGAWGASLISIKNRAGEAVAIAEAELRIAALSAPENIRHKIGDRWAERARFEHASVASFARFSMALLACGAPPALITASHEAAIDEVRHAQIALAIASAYCETGLDIGPLDVRGAFGLNIDLEETVLATVVEGCVGETLAAIEVAETAGLAENGVVRGALFSIAEDETRHAELSWAFVRWALGNGDSKLMGRVKTAFSIAFEKVLAESMEGEDLPGAERYGVLGAQDVKNLRRKAIDEVLRPAAMALFNEKTRGVSLKQNVEQTVSLS